MKQLTVVNIVGLAYGKAASQTTANRGLTMDNPEESETTINVKRVKVTSWESARKLAAKHGEHMGATLSRAIDQMANSDTLPREIPPFHPGNPIAISGNPASDLVPLLNAAAAVAAATGGKITVVPGLAALLRDRVRAERGLPPSQLRLTAGQSVGQSFNKNGQSRQETALLENGQGDP